MTGRELKAILDKMTDEELNNTVWFLENEYEYKEVVGGGCTPKDGILLTHFPYEALLSLQQKRKKTCIPPEELNRITEEWLKYFKKVERMVNLVGECGHNTPEYFVKETVEVERKFFASDCNKPLSENLKNEINRVYYLAHLLEIIE